jgi:hypothetical protein
MFDLFVASRIAERRVQNQFRPEPRPRSVVHAGRPSTAPPTRTRRVAFAFRLRAT